MRRVALVAAAAALGALFTQTSARGGVPRVMSFQGRLSDANGDAVADGDYSVAFRIYGQETGGAPLWEEPRTVSVAGGLCSVLLGVVTPLDLPFDAQYWLAVEVQSDGEMEPRFRLAAAPYALRAKDADSVGGVSVGGLLQKATYDSDGDGKVDSAANAETATDADTVDGKHAAELADATHGHDADYVNVTGDTMMGALTLAGDPSNPLEAATRQFVESVAGSGVSSLGAGTGIVLTPDPITETGTIAAKIGTLAGMVAEGNHSHTGYVLEAGDTMAGNLSLGGNELTNVRDIRLEALATAPEVASAAEGLVYYNVTQKRLEYSNGTEWVPVEPVRKVKATTVAVIAANAVSRVTAEFGAEYRVATAFEALALLSVKGTASVGTGTYWVEGADPVGGTDDDQLFTPAKTSNCPYTDPSYYWAVEVQTGGRVMLQSRAQAETHRVLAIEKE